MSSSVLCRLTSEAPDGVVIKSNGKRFSATIGGVAGSVVFCAAAGGGVGLRFGGRFCTFGIVTVATLVESALLGACFGKSADAVVTIAGTAGTAFGTASGGVAPAGATTIAFCRRHPENTRANVKAATVIRPEFVPYLV